jgi:hypothetical protein
VVLALFAAVAQARATAHSEFFGEAKDWTLWSAVVTGSVFCDQCLQDRVFPFSEPMDGIILVSIFLCPIRILA